MFLWSTIELGEGEGGFQLVPVPRKMGLQGWISNRNPRENDLYKWKLEPFTGSLK